MYKELAKKAYQAFNKNKNVKDWELLKKRKQKKWVKVVKSIVYANQSELSWIDIDKDGLPKNSKMVEVKYKMPDKEQIFYGQGHYTKDDGWRLEFETEEGTHTHFFKASDKNIVVTSYRLSLNNNWNDW